MSLDPVRVADTQAWFARVDSDPLAAEVDLSATPSILDDLAFHCQQAVEKVLKAYLTWHDEPFRRTHDLRELANQCVEIDSTLEPILQRAIPLAQYAWAFRYPNTAPLPTQEEAAEMLTLAREVRGAVFDRLPDEVRP